MNIGCSKKQQVKPEVPRVCSSSAYVDIKTYEIKPLVSKNDKEFHRWVADEYATKYPTLLDAYKALLECDQRYR